MVAAGSRTEVVGSKTVASGTKCKTEATGSKSKTEATGSKTEPIARVSKTSKKQIGALPGVQIILIKSVKTHTQQC